MENKMDLNEERLTCLKNAIDQRKRDIMIYQINIDNYEMAIHEITENHSDQEYLVTFANHLVGLLESSRQEQTKEMILLKVSEMQYNMVENA